MRFIRNQNGIALVTSLMFTVICLVISMSLLYMITSGISTSGAMKRYQSTIEATYGGTDIVVKDLVAASFAFSSYSVAHPGTSYTSYMQSTYMGSLNGANVSNCLRTKLTTPRSQWTTACANTNLDAKVGTDITFNLNAATGTPFTVYSKIVDTMERKFSVLETYSGVKKAKTVIMAGNTESSSTALEFGSTTDGSGVTVPHYPYVYRIEVQGERQSNASENSKISVLYAY